MSESSKENSKATEQRKPSNSYSLLQMKMNEVEKIKKPANPTSKSSSSISNKKTSDKGFKRDKDKSSSAPAKSSKPEPPKQDTDPNLPDRSYGDYFCKICDSHMNSDAMWEAHVTGKRHIKNVKKGDTDSKYDDLDVESDIKYELRNVKDPVIGLSYIHEIRRREPGVPAMYNCFLCHASIATVPLVIEHIIGMKHRLNFLRENNPEEYQLIESTNLKKGHMEPLIHEAAARLETEFGRGTVKVKQEKPKSTLTSYKRSRDDSDEEKGGFRKSSKNKSSEGKTPNVWKSVDVSIRDMSRRDYGKDDLDRRETRSLYPDSYSPMEEFSRSRSFRDRITPERDIYPRNYSRSPERDISRRSEYYGPALPEDYRRLSDDIRRPLDDVRRPSDPYGPVHYSDPRSFQAVDNVRNSPSFNRSTPVETPNIQPERLTKEIFKDFVTQIAALPTDLFFKIVLMKLDTIELQGLDELNMLSKIINKAYNVVTSKLPPDFQAILKEKMAQNENGPKMSSAMPNLSGLGQSNNIPSQMSSEMHFNPPVQQKFDIGAINELIFGARKESDSASINRQAQSSNFNANIAPSASNPYRMPLPAAPIPPPSAAFTPANTCPPPRANYLPQVNTPALSQPPIFPPQSSSGPNYQNYYNSPPGKQPQSIPGLTLTEKNENPQRQSFDFPSQQQWSGPNARGNNYNYGGY